jgi:hypothetical protein
MKRKTPRHAGVAKMEEEKEKIKLNSRFYFCRFSFSPQLKRHVKRTARWFCVVENKINVEQSFLLGCFASFHRLPGNLI